MNITDSNVNRQMIEKSIELYFDKIYPSKELKQKFNNFKHDFSNKFETNYKKMKIIISLSGDDETQTEIVAQTSTNLINFAGTGGEILSYNIFNKMQFNDIIHEPNGKGTHPDFLLKKDNEDIFTEIKTIYCNNLNNNKIKVNNATNSEGAVRSYLNEYKKYVYNNKFNINEFIKNNDIKKETRQFFETFVIFYYYEITDNYINYFDFEIVPLPVVITFKLNENGTLFYDNDNNIKLVPKSAGEISQNNNVTLSLGLNQLFDNDKNLLIDPLMLYLLNYTHLNNNYIIPTKEINYNTGIEYINNFYNLINNIDTDNLTIDICNNYLNTIKSNHNNIIKKYKSLYNDKFNSYFVDYENAKKEIKNNILCIEFLNINNELLNTTDKSLYQDFKKLYNRLKNHGITKYYDLYNNQKIKYKRIR